MNTTFKKKTGVVLFIIFAIFCGLQFVFNNSLTANAEIALTASADGSVKTSANSLTLHPYSYIQDFEGTDPFQKWASNGTYTVNYKGVTTERASSGKQSVKIDITFDTATYLYWSIPVKVPSVGELNFKGDIYVSQVSGTPSAALGTDILLLPCPLSGNSRLQTINTVTNNWIKQSSDLVVEGLSKAKTVTSKYMADSTSDDVGIWCGKLALYMFGKKGDRITVYVDNLELKGNVPDITEYTAIANANWAAYQSRINEKINAIKAELGTYKADEIEKLTAALKTKGYISLSESESLNSIVEDFKFGNAPKEANTNFIIYPWEPTSERKILPDTFPIPTLPANTVEIKACPGEYEPASFIIRATKDIAKITITKTNLLSEGGNSIDSSNLDIKLVKCWYQGGINDIYLTSQKYMVPELLINDDSLINVDTNSQTNYLKVILNNQPTYIDITKKDFVMPANAIIKDADSLQPFDLKSETNKQIWLTLKVPENAKSDIYTSKIQIKAENIEPVTLELKVNVLGFKLAEPDLEYSIYYRGILSSQEPTTISSHVKNSTQYRIEMDNMKEHGLSSSTIYQELDSKLLKDSLQIRTDAGMNGENLYVLAFESWTGNPTSDGELNALKDKVTKWIEFAKNYQYSNVFIYGIDEANLDVIQSELKAWEVVHKAGAGILVACLKPSVDVAKGLLDIGVVRDGLDQKVAENWHAHGAKLFSYGNPQVGVENPYIYRKNYGIDLWLADYDGAMNFAYQYEMGNIWNDFDHSKYRDHVFTYPITNGVIDTIQWEGFREAIDDVRYITKLLSTGSIDKASLKQSVVKMQQDGDSLSQMRENIISKIKQ